ncbi:hypothetical protein AUF62_00815 [archaeon 13_1_20CM_52_20]|nr:MAG: hypothetical protein AUF62_00815 [archaeon 13_1_20CM_52_20]
MLDPIVLPTLYFVAVIELIFQAGVVFYAYKVTRITGSFRAWTLIIAAFSLLTIQSVVGLALTLSLPADQIANLVSSVGRRHHNYPQFGGHSDSGSASVLRGLWARKTI